MSRASALELMTLSAALSRETRIEFCEEIEEQLEVDTRLIGRNGLMMNYRC